MKLQAALPRLLIAVGLAARSDTDRRQPRSPRLCSYRAVDAPPWSVGAVRPCRAFCSRHRLVRARRNVSVSSAGRCSARCGARSSTLPGATIGATAAFLVARYVAADWVRVKAGPRSSA